MKVAILSDIHANLAAFQAVLADADQQKVDEVWFLGDLVVYGPQPRECIDLLRQREIGREGLARVTHRLRGNNDDAVMLHHAPDSALDRMVGLRNLSDSDELRVKATEDSYAWTERVLTDEDRNFLKKAEDHPVELKSGECVLLHASPCDPVGNEGNYLRSVEDAEEALARLAENPLVRVCFFGHTHIASAYQQVVLDRPYANVKEYRFNDLRRPISLVNASGGLPARWLVNPGSVGQPRDGVREASYALFDDDRWIVEFRRVPYDWQKTVDAINAISIDSLSGDSKSVLSRRIETGGRE